MLGLIENYDYISNVVYDKYIDMGAKTSLRLGPHSEEEKQASNLMKEFYKIKEDMAKSLLATVSTAISNASEEQKELIKDSYGQFMRERADILVNIAKSDTSIEDKKVAIEHHILEVITRDAPIKPMM